MTVLHPLTADIERQWRIQIRREALSWVGTPYILGAHLKGVGCDCYTLIAEVMIRSGVMDAEDLPIYAGDWWAHISEEKYLYRVMRFATKVFDGRIYQNKEVKTGNVLAVRAAGTKSEVFNHGGIVTTWPRAVHSVDPRAEEFDVISHHMWAGQTVRVFNPWGRLGSEQ